VPIPTPGVQLVTLSHVEDVASMLALVPGNPAAIRQYYNVCSDRQISFTGVLCTPSTKWCPNGLCSQVCTLPHLVCWFGLEAMVVCGSHMCIATVSSRAGATT